MDALTRALLTAPRLVVYDSFDRSDSSLTLGDAETGQAWQVIQGTFGVSSNRAYSVTNVNGDMVLVDSGVSNCLVEVVSNGTPNNGSVFSVAEVILRELDSSNYLRVFLYNGSMRLGKVDGGVGSTIKTQATASPNATDTEIWAEAKGDDIILYKNGVAILTHTLTGGDTKYSAGTKHGMRLFTAGSPATPARWDNFKVTGI